MIINSANFAIRSVNKATFIRLKDQYEESIKKFVAEVEHLTENKQAEKIKILACQLAADYDGYGLAILRFSVLDDFYNF